MFRCVAPFAGAWIEIANSTRPVIANAVAPFAGAWIEILRGQRCVDIGTSLPSRERGLKSARLCAVKEEIRRSLRGSVD